MRRWQRWRRGGRGGARQCEGMRGDIPPLVALLDGGQAGNASAMEQACRAVYNVTVNVANRAAFITAGGVPPLTAAVALCEFEDADELLARFL